MAKIKIVTALDIGSSSIKMLSVSRKGGEENIEILSQRQEPSAGIRKGVVIDPAKTGEIISLLSAKTKEDCEKRISSVYATIGGSHISCVSSRGLVSVSRADQKISQEDVERVLQAAQTFSLSSNKEVMEIFPKYFSVDGESGVKEPIGMQGVRLEADISAVCGFSPYIRNSSQAIAISGLQAEEFLPSILASSEAVLSQKEKELGVCTLDLGAGTTGMSVFEEGVLSHLAIFPVGSGNITNDIAICLKADIDTAEKIKIEFGSCKISLQNTKKVGKLAKKIRVEPVSDSGFDLKEAITFTKKSLTDIIEARVSEIFSIVNKELKNISKHKLLPAGIVLTGGGAKLPGIKDLAKREFKLPCRIGIPRFYSAFHEDPAFSAVYGLAIEGFSMEEDDTPFSGSFGSKIKKIFKIFIP
jgi:cell division protein FtsA